MSAINEIEREALALPVEQRAQLVSLREWIDACLERVHVRLCHLASVRKLLEELQAELEAGWRPIGP